MPLESLLPSLPWTLTETLVNMVGVLGAILITYAVFLEVERKQDAVFVVAAACLLVYALWVGNTIFILAMAGLLIGGFFELIEIMRGHHKHSKALVEEYKHPHKE